MQLSLSLRGIRFDFAACLTAALVFVQDNQAHRCVDQVTVALADTTALRRLPNEQLYLEP
ncbi:hypothetical protein [Nocardia beijingensis]|uniref:hypothetical protein n=1 Tax=Nocardia beijingensis TaxID=95162 RepID=UPI0012F518B5|nr:hypothetical protein [Nocardia beijingensis]MBF6073851.1 hypothetical protein [Nocardia beijingensis]